MAFVCENWAKSKMGAPELKGKSAFFCVLLALAIDADKGSVREGFTSAAQLAGKTPAGRRTVQLALDAFVEWGWLRVVPGPKGRLTTTYLFWQAGIGGAAIAQVGGAAIAPLEAQGAQPLRGGGAAIATTGATTAPDSCLTTRETPTNTRVPADTREGSRSLSGQGSKPALVRLPLMWAPNAATLARAAEWIGTDDERVRVVVARFRLRSEKRGEVNADWDAAFLEYCVWEFEHESRLRARATNAARPNANAARPALRVVPNANDEAPVNTGGYVPFRLSGTAEPARELMPFDRDQQIREALAHRKWCRETGLVPTPGDWRDHPRFDEFDPAKKAAS